MDVRLEREFPEAGFDITYGSGIWRHLDLARSYAEVPRALEPADALGIFTELLGHNLVIDAYRKCRPTLRHPRSSEVEGVYCG